MILFLTATDSTATDSTATDSSATVTNFCESISERQRRCGLGNVETTRNFLTDPNKTKFENVIAALIDRQKKIQEKLAQLSEETSDKDEKRTKLEEEHEGIYIDVINRSTEFYEAKKSSNSNSSRNLNDPATLETSNSLEQNVSQNFPNDT